MIAIKKNWPNLFALKWNNLQNILLTTTTTKNPRCKTVYIASRIHKTHINRYVHSYKEREYFWKHSQGTH